eukprot:6461427-Amphidinium_carterae.2
MDSQLLPTLRKPCWIGDNAPMDQPQLNEQNVQRWNVQPQPSVLQNVQSQPTSLISIRSQPMQSTHALYAPWDDAASAVSVPHAAATGASLCASSDTTAAAPTDCFEHERNQTASTWSSECSSSLQWD